MTIPPALPPSDPAATGPSGPPPLPPLPSFPSLKSSEQSANSAAEAAAAAADRDSAEDPDTSDDAGRRQAKRRPAGPPRQRIAANDDAPSIGGLIYALNQKPSNTPYVRAGMASVAWVVVGLGLVGYAFGSQMSKQATVAEILAMPALLPAIAAIALPPFLFYFLAMLMWRSEELKLRSSAMTEVAVRLAEPDRSAEQAVASLGQAVRRQVTFMNEAVERALGRAGELEALVHNEISLLDRSFEENERRIRTMMQELARERVSLATTGDGMHETLRAVGAEVPALIEKLTQQQLKLTSVIANAGENLTQLETALATQTGQLETSIGGKTLQLQSVLDDYTTALNEALGSRTEQMHTLLQDHLQMVGQAMDSGNRALGQSIDGKVEAIEQTIADRTKGIETVFEEYSKALDTTLANRAQALDMQLVERTKALDDAFSDRLRLFDESILRSTNAIDSAVGDTARALTSALEHHARSMSETIGRQAVEIDETLMNGITAVRRTSENITRQSLKAIEGLAGQADMLKNVSENLLSQISQVTNRFESQGHTIMRAANALESANYKIDATLQHRQAELGKTLDKLSGRADDLGRVFQGYSSTLEGSLSEAERRARQLAEDLSRSADQKSRQTIAELERLKIEASGETDRAMDDLRQKFSSVSREVSERLGNMTNQFDETSQQMRDRAARAASELEAEQARLREQMTALPTSTREQTETMRRALQDQLRALEQLSSLTSREAARRDVAPPRAMLPPPAARDDRSQVLNSLTSTLAQEMAQRQRPSSTPAAPATPGAMAPPPPAAADAREQWSLGDLLKRASYEDEGPGGPAPTQPPGQNSLLPLDALSRCLDMATAGAIWNRFRTGQRNFMVRSIYSEEGRLLFDDVTRRYRNEPMVQQAVHRFLVEFEGTLRQAEARDPSGQLVQGQLVSEMGRAYLLLAHASGRLA